MKRLKSAGALRWIPFVAGVLFSTNTCFAATPETMDEFRYNMGRALIPYCISRVDEGGVLERVNDKFVWKFIAPRSTLDIAGIDRGEILVQVSDMSTSQWKTVDEANEKWVSALVDALKKNRPLVVVTQANVDSEPVERNVRAGVICASSGDKVVAASSSPEVEGKFDKAFQVARTISMGAYVSQSTGANLTLAVNFLSLLSAMRGGPSHPTSASVFTGADYLSADVLTMIGLHSIGIDISDYVPWIKRTGSHTGQMDSNGVRLAGRQYGESDLNKLDVAQKQISKGELRAIESDFGIKTFERATGKFIAVPPEKYTTELITPININVTDIYAVPRLSASGRAYYNQWLEQPFPRAFAISPAGASGWASAKGNAGELALEACNRHQKGECKLYAVNNTVLWQDAQFSIASNRPGDIYSGDYKVVPALSKSGAGEYRKFAQRPYPRAFALSPNGAFGWASGNADAVERAIETCNSYQNGTCKLYAMDNKVVWWSNQMNDSLREK